MNSSDNSSGSLVQSPRKSQSKIPSHKSKLIIPLSSFLSENNSYIRHLVFTRGQILQQNWLFTKLNNLLSSGEDRKSMIMEEGSQTSMNYETKVQDLTTISENSTLKCYAHLNDCLVLFATSTGFSGFQTSESLKVSVKEF